MTSIIIPSSQDPYLQKTIDSLLENAYGEIEIIPVLDSFIPQVPLKSHSQVKPIDLPLNYTGMRAAINAGLEHAKGEFIMKCDSHCLFGPGYDKIMTENCAENWLLIPRRYSLDEDNWKINPGGHVYDYHYFCFPRVSPYGHASFVSPWVKRDRRNQKIDFDDTMAFQGSCWLANRKYFMDHVGPLDDRPETYGAFAGDQQEVGLKYWLGDGEVKVIKSAWYAHLSKRPQHYKSGMYDRSYKVGSQAVAGHTWTTKHWLNNSEPGMSHSFSWLIEKFWPVPTWPEDRSLWTI